MQYVNDDMDELFRRAAENYPLDTSGADWNKVLAAMKNETGTKTVSENKRNKNGRFLWLLLLLPLGFICNQLYSPRGLNNKEISGTNQARENHVRVEKNIQQEDNTRNSVGTNNDKATIVEPTGIDGEELNAVNQNKNQHAISLPFLKKSNSSKGILKKNNREFSVYNPAFSEQVNGHGINSEDFPTRETSFSKTYVSEIIFQKVLHDRPSTMVNRSFIPLINSPEEAMKPKSAMEKKKRFYIGLMGGIDATTIKFQKIENAGFTYGLLFGYQFNKKWSLETGAYLENKYYYSDGKYFNTSKISMPPNSRIDDVSGGCKMIELPVVVKYNFSSHRSSSWFATLGTSSYFLKKEKYTYNYYYGTTGPVPHEKEYKNSSTNLFSNISISGGYTHKLGSFADLRIEPYLKLPVSKMGIGDLPLFSTGLQIGFTKKF